MDLSKNPELDSLTPPKGTFSQEELMNLLNIYKSNTLETNLKVSAAEQILLHLLSGIQYENIIEEIINSAFNCLLPDSEDRYIKRLISKSLQVLVLIALKYENKAKRLYSASVKFLCSLLPYIFNSYDQIRHFSMHLLFILAFSAHCPRNRFIPTEIFTLLPEASHKPYAVPIISNLSTGFLMPFAVQYLSPEFYPTAEFLRY